MNYLVLILVALAGIALGMYIARRRVNAGFIAEQNKKGKKLYGGIVLKEKNS